MPAVALTAEVVELSLNVLESLLLELPELLALVEEPVVATVSELVDEL